MISFQRYTNFEFILVVNITEKILIRPIMVVTWHQLPVLPARSKTDSSILRSLYVNISSGHNTK